MQHNYNFDNIIISFSRPENESSDYEFLKNPDETIGGGLRSQIVLIKKQVSLKKLIKDFYRYSEKTTAVTELTSGLIIAAVMTASFNLLAVKKFPDQYKDLLALLKTTPRGTSLNSPEIEKLIKENPELIKVLDALTEQEFLTKKANNNYIVKKKTLMHLSCDFL